MLALDEALRPDGRHVVFSDVGGEDEDLFVVDVATGERWALTDGPGNDGKALWSPDGRTVVYGNESGMWAIPVSGGRAAGASRLLRRDVVWPSAWTEHGYYYTATNMITRAHRIGVDPATGRATYGQPTFSPDGSRILFLRNPFEGGATATVPFSLWVIEADGSNERLLDETSAMIRPPVWDPTGRMAAYMARDAGEERFRLVVVSVADGTTHEIEAFHELGDATLQAWSPDGAWIGVTESVGRREVWVNRDVLEGGL